MTAGYSGTPLWKKLGLVADMSACVINPPSDYPTLITGSPQVTWGPLEVRCAFVHLFTADRAELAEVLARALPLIDRDGMIWVSGPKKSSRVPTDITEDVVRDVALPLGLVDVKVCAVDAIWSGLKLVIRKNLR